MMTMMFLHALLVLILVSQVQGEHARPCGPLILWSQGCDEYNITEGVYPKAPGIHEQFSLITLSECRSLCTKDRECGGFTWWDGTSTGGSTSCRLYNINEHIINEQLTGALLYWPSDASTWGSKTCPYETGASDLACNVYTNTVPVNTSITHYYSFAQAHSFTMTAAHCHSWCTLYAGCKSVTYYRGHFDTGTCYLHPYTVEELQAAGSGYVIVNPHNVWETINYVRFCADGSRYIPECARTTTTTTTTEPPNPGKGNGGGCLHGEDQVITSDGVGKKVKDIMPGDKVMSLSDSGEIIYDDIYLITHTSPDQIVEFTSIKVDDKPGKLSLTGSHMIIVDGIEKTAGQVRPQDQVYVLDNMTGEMMLGAVTSVTREYRRGIFNPITLTGRMVVNNILVSAYPHVYQPLTAPVMHNTLWVVRMLYHYDIVNITATGGRDMPIVVKYAVKMFDLIFTTN